MEEYSHEERAQIVRGLLGSKGWQMYAETVSQKFEQVRDQFMLESSERHPDYKTWTPDKLAGMSIGLGWARNVMQHWLAAYEQAQKTKDEKPVEEEGTGHPYAEEPSAIAQ